MPVAIPFTIYALNVVWSMILSISAGLWPAAVAAVSKQPAAITTGTPRAATGGIASGCARAASAATAAGARNALG